MNLIDRIKAHHGVDEARVKGVLLDSGDLTVSPAKRLVTAIANTDAVDSDREIVLPSGAERDEAGQIRYFGAAKAIYYNHDYAALPIGSFRSARLTDRGWVTQFHLSAKNPMADIVMGLIEEEAVNGVSIGFQPLESGPLSPEERSLYGPDPERITRRWKWLELSVTPMPANPEAWITSVEKSACPECVAVAIDRMLTKGTIAGAARDVARKMIGERKKTLVIVV